MCYSSFDTVLSRLARVTLQGRHSGAQKNLVVGALSLCAGLDVESTQTLNYALRIVAAADILLGLFLVSVLTRAFNLLLDLTSQYRLLLELPQPATNSGSASFSTIPAHMFYTILSKPYDSSDPVSFI